MKKIQLEIDNPYSSHNLCLYIRTKRNILTRMSEFFVLYPTSGGWSYVIKSRKTIWTKKENVL